MTDAELIDHIAKCSGITKAQAKKALDCMYDGIITGLKESVKLKLAIGTFIARKLKARTIKNPITGELEKSSADMAVAFNASRMLRDAISETK